MMLSKYLPAMANAARVIRCPVDVQKNCGTMSLLCASGAVLPREWLQSTCVSGHAKAVAQEILHICIIIKPDPVRPLHFTSRRALRIWCLTKRLGGLFDLTLSARQANPRDQQTPPTNALSPRSRHTSHVSCAPHFALPSCPECLSFCLSDQTSLVHFYFTSLSPSMLLSEEHVYECRCRRIKYWSTIVWYHRVPINSGHL